MLASDFVASKTIADFIGDNSRVKFMLGPLGSGKTTGIVVDLLRRSILQKPDAEGIRPTRWVVVRNTLPQLRQTIVPEIMQVCGPLCTYKIADNKFLFNFLLPDGTRVMSEWLLNPLNDITDQRRLLSLNLTGAWISEFREIKFELLGPIMGRLSRYPAMKRVEPTWDGVMGESNPFSEGSDWHKALILNKPESWKLYWQPGGLSPEAENRKYLRANYYEELIEGHSEDWVNVHVHARLGKDLSGQAVYGNQFNRKLHTKTGVRPSSVRPLIVGWDFGRTPAALIMQTDLDGRVWVFHEVVAEDTGTENFADRFVTPVLRHPRFSFPAVCIAPDPAGWHKTQLGEKSPCDALMDRGFSVARLSSNDYDVRHRAIEWALWHRIGQHPYLNIDADFCPKLIQALAYEYRYRMKRTNELEDRPQKNHPWSDLVDALGYGLMAISSGATAHAFNRETENHYIPKPLPSRVWA